MTQSTESVLKCRRTAKKLTARTTFVLVLSLLLVGRTILLSTNRSILQNILDVDDAPITIAKDTTHFPGTKRMTGSIIGVSFEESNDDDDDDDDEVSPAVAETNRLRDEWYNRSYPPGFAQTWKCRMFSYLCQERRSKDERPPIGMAKEIAHHHAFFGLGLAAKNILCIVCLLVGILIELHHGQRENVRTTIIIDEVKDVGLHRGLNGLFSSALMTNAKQYWNCTLKWSQPVLTFKIYVAALMLLSGSIHMPEMFIVKGTPTIDLPYMPDVVSYVTPGLSEETEKLWYERLDFARNILIISWLGYLCLPPRILGGTCYVIGAVLQIYFHTVTYLWSQKSNHDKLGTILFLFASIFAVPFFGCPRNGSWCSSWLRKYLYVAVLFPLYLSAGFCKFRYKGVRSQFSGSWIRKVLKNNKQSFFPEINRYVTNHAWASAFFSWGNVVVELILPLITLLRLDSCRRTRMSFHAVCILFHATIFLLMGPRFLEINLLHFFLGADPLSALRVRMIAPKLERQEISSVAWDKWLGRVQLGIAFYAIFGFFWVQFRSDVEHLMGTVHRLERRDPIFPFSEYPMFAFPSEPNYAFSLLLVTTTLVCYVIVIFTSWSRNYNKGGARVISPIFCERCSE
jgi:hypothetical protein